MEIRDFDKQYTCHLNVQQQAAVHQVDGPVLLLAVPGSGKTTVLVTRLGYMVYCRGIAPERILTLTYTVAATQDMRERFLRIFGDEELGARLEFRTINGICARIIAWYGRQVGKSSFELETNDKRILAILSGIYQKLENAYPTEMELASIRTQITYIKNMRLSSEDIEKIPVDGDYHLEDIYREYCACMRAQGKMDYDDQMIYAFNILRRSPQTLEFFRSCYPYICVDEAQDTSRIQHEIIALLAGGQENLFMVGDEDQSIYGFRAAWPEALLSFEKDHPGAKILLMEKNYRSVSSIVSACDAFIQRNTMRHVKHMQPVRTEVGQLRSIPLKGRGAQYTYLLKVAEGASQGLNGDRSTAILYRDNESGIPLIDLLDRRGIPYRIRNRELGFFTHRVVQDIRNIMLFAMHPADPDLFLNVYYKLGTFMNRQLAQKACDLADRYHMGILDAAVEKGSMNFYQAKSCRLVLRHLSALREDDAATALQRILGPMGYSEYLNRSGVKDTKTATLRILARQEASLKGFLNRLEELERLIASGESTGDGRLILSTIHGSKGLEYDIVYLLDVMDGIFPETVPEGGGRVVTSKNEEEIRLYEEERRLFYVGATRAKEILNVFPVEGRDCTFLEELTQKTEKTTVEKPGFVKPLSKGKPKRQVDEDGFRRFCADLGEGMPVTHKSLGAGVIVGINETTVTIAFEESERRFLLGVLYKKDLLEY